MDRSAYIKMCRKASMRVKTPGAHRAVSRNADELVRWRGDLYVPVDYRFNFSLGVPQHTAILCCPTINSLVHVPLKEVEA